MTQKLLLNARFRLKISQKIAQNILELEVSKMFPGPDVSCYTNLRRKVVFR